MTGSVSAFIFMRIRVSSPASQASIVRSISSIRPWREWVGETSALRKLRGRAYPVKRLKTSATSAAMSGSVVKSPKSS